MHKTSRTRRRRWRAVELYMGPIGFMVMVYICLRESHKNRPNVGKHIIYGILWVMLPSWERSHIPYRFRHFWVDECSFPVRWEFCDRSLEGICFGNTKGCYSEASMVIAHLKIFLPRKTNMTFMFLDSLGLKRNHPWSSRTCYPMAVLGHALRCRTSSSKQWIMFGL